MVQISRDPIHLKVVSDGLEEGLTQARGIVGAVAERAEDFLVGLDLDASAVGSDVREAVARVRAGGCTCPQEVQAARDSERLKSAAMAGVLIFVASALVLLVARRIVTRRAEEERQRRIAERASERDQPAVV
jgi:uncharacterized protein YgbK (DUF1537 family)